MFPSSPLLLRRFLFFFSVLFVSFSPSLPMSGHKRFDLFDPFSTSSCLFCRENSSFSRPRALLPFPSPFADAVELVEEHLGLSLDPPNPSPSPLDIPLQCLLPFPPLISPLDFFDSAADLILIDRPVPPCAVLRRLQDRAETERCLRSLSGRIAALELELDRALCSGIDAVDRRYKWTAEIRGPKEERFDRKYKLMTEMKARVERNARWTVEVKGKGRDEPMSHTYSFHASTVPAGTKHHGLEKAKKGSNSVRSTAGVVKIEESLDRRPVISRKVHHISFF